MGGTRDFCKMYPKTCYGNARRGMSATRNYQQMYGNDPRIAMRARSYVGPASAFPSIDAFRQAMTQIITDFANNPVKDVAAFTTALKNRIQTFLNDLFAWIGSSPPAVP